MQSKLGSAIEVGVNVVIGFSINYVANLIILPAFGFTALSHKTNFLIGVLYTVISVVRSYVIRRWFNALIVRAANSAANVITRSK